MNVFTGRFKFNHCETKRDIFKVFWFNIGFIFSFLTQTAINFQFKYYLSLCLIASNICSGRFHSRWMLCTRRLIINWNPHKSKVCKLQRWSHFAEKPIIIKAALRELIIYFEAFHVRQLGYICSLLTVTKLLKLISVEI